MRKSILCGLTLVAAVLAAMAARAQDKESATPEKAPRQKADVPEKSPSEETATPEKPRPETAGPQKSPSREATTEEQPPADLPPEESVEKELKDFDSQNWMQWMADAESHLSADGRQIIKKITRLQAIQDKALKVKERYDANEGAFRDRVDRAQAFCEECKSDLDRIKKIENQKQAEAEFKDLLKGKSIKREEFADYLAWQSANRALAKCAAGIETWNRMLHKPVEMPPDDLHHPGWRLDQQADENMPGADRQPVTEPTGTEGTGEYGNLLRAYKNSSAEKVPSESSGSNTAAPAKQSSDSSR